MDLFHQQLQVSQATFNGTRPTNNQDDQQAYASSVIPNGNTSKIEARPFQVGGNEIRLILLE